jgi:hypothetical protein
MNDQMQNGMAEATRLTQLGRLDEATAVIQRALGGTFAPAAQGDSGNTDEPIEAISRLVRHTPRGPAGPRRKTSRRPSAAKWTTPGPTLFHRGGQPLAGTRLEDPLPSASLKEPASSSVRIPTAQAPVPTNCISRAATPGRLFH